MIRAFLYLNFTIVHGFDERDLLRLFMASFTPGVLAVEYRVMFVTDYFTHVGSSYDASRLSYWRRWR